VWLFQVRIYADDSVATDLKQKLRTLGAQVVSPPPELAGHTNSGSRAMFWRFLVADDPGVDVYQIRDIDSRLGSRERSAVDEWLASGARFHVMRDHPCFSYHPIFGGVWGGRVRLGGLQARIVHWEKHGNVNRYMNDVEFLSEEVWPLIKDMTFQHDAFSCERYGAHPFPTPRDQIDDAILHPHAIFLHSRPLFLGQTFFGNGSRTIHDIKTMQKTLEPMSTGRCEAQSFPC